MLPSRKRARPAGGQSAQRRAMFASMAAARRYPYSDFGRQYIPRGHYLSQAGPSYRGASPAQRAWRKANNYHGVGMYTGGGMYTGQGGFWKSLGRGFRKLGKTKLARGLRHELSRDIGAVADTFIPGAGAVTHAGLKAAGIGMYTGQGGYAPAGGGQVVKNELIAGGHSSEGVMRFDAQNDEDAIVVSHSEYVMDVYAPPDGVDKADIKLLLNAGENGTFPMLSQLAANFEDYEIVQLAFTYKPTLSDWQTTTGQVGQVLIATNYNPNAELWQTKQQMLAQTGSTSARTIDASLHGVECDTSKMHNDGHYLVRTGPPRLNTNLTDFDHGWTQISVVDMPAGTGNKTLGELHVSYTIKLSKPRIWTGIANALPCAMKTWTDSAGKPFEIANTCDVTGLGDSFKCDVGNLARVEYENFLTARQGSIPFQVNVENTSGPYNGGHAWTCITLPAQFSGSLSVKLRCVFTGERGLQADVSPALFLADHVGQVEPIEDMHTTIGGGQFPALLANQARTNKWDPWKPEHGFVQVGTYANGDAIMVYPMSVQSYSKTSDGSSTIVSGDHVMVGEGHFRVGVARDQVDNKVCFALALPITFQQQSLIKGISIELSAYNTRVNYRQDGTNDKVILVDKAEQVVTY